MKRKEKAKVIAGLIVASVALGCGLTDPVRRDLANYVNQGILNIAELEQKSLQRYASVTGPNYTADERVYEALRDDVVPLYKRFLDGLMQIRPETDDVKKLHRIYIIGAEQLHEGFKEKMYGIELQNEAVILSANSKIERGAAENVKWRQELFALAEKHGLAKEEKKGKLLEWWNRIWE